MLYIVGTAIGNIQDTSLRAVKTLTESDIILCEDTRSFDSYYKKIQTLFSQKSQKEQRIVHFHKENEFEKVPWVIDELENNKAISLVSESGMPTISDPGYVVIEQVIKANLKFTVIPGPSAFTTAVVLSGFPAEQILFLGFLPKKLTHIMRMFNSAKNAVSKHLAPVIVFYESPHRIEKTLKLIHEICPHAEIAVTREMTKKFEEVLRGNVKNVIRTNYKGELTVVMKLKLMK